MSTEHTTRTARAEGASSAEVRAAKAKLAAQAAENTTKAKRTA